MHNGTIVFFPVYSDFLFLVINFVKINLLRKSTMGIELTLKHDCWINNLVDYYHNKKTLISHQLW